MKENESEHENPFNYDLRHISQKMRNEKKTEFLKKSLGKPMIQVKKLDIDELKQLGKIE